jgi:hypothetical protein
MNRRAAHLTASLLAGVLVLAIGCRSAYYAAWEKLGYHKRDILKDRVIDARDEQQAASEQFKDALTKLKEVYAFEGGDLEDTYRDLESEFEEAQQRAEAVRERIESMETVAGDLFEEWEEEIGQISSPSMGASSRRTLRDTQRRYEEMRSALTRAEESMQPVLGQFRDYTLYLKHNLNAQAIASLKGEAVDIEREIAKLVEEMNASIARADAFVRTLE